MILTEYIQIKVTLSKVDYYNNLGYNVQKGDIIKIKPTELTNGSHTKIDCKCDICDKITSIFYQTYVKSIKNGGFYCCSSKCAQSKVKKTSLEKFGTEYYTKTDEYKIKCKETSLAKYGTEHFTQSDIVKDKIVKTNMERYGYDNPSKSPEIIQKIKDVFMDKYGVDNISKCEHIREFLSANNKLKYPIYSLKVKETNMRNHGVEYAAQIPGVMDKVKATNILRHGVNCGLDINRDQIKAMKSKISIWKNNKISNDDNIIDIDLLNKKIIYKCEHGHISEMDYGTYRNRECCNTIMCIICNPVEHKTSGMELQLLEYIKTIYIGEIITNTKSIITPFELDIYLPELKLAFEFNGMYWHNDTNKDVDYHKNKSDSCRLKNIELVHIWEDLWLNKNSILKDIIYNKIHKPQLFNKKYYISDVSDVITKDFINNNHINGYIKSSINIGLYSNKNELVSIMCFIKSENNYIITRFCNKINNNFKNTNKLLFNYFKDNYTFDTVSYTIDLCYENNDMYNKLGFVLSEYTTPKSFRIVNGIREDLLIQIDDTLFPSHKIHNIYDAGGRIYIYKNNE